LSRSLAIRPPVVQRGIRNQERGDRVHIDRGDRTADSRYSWSSRCSQGCRNRPQAEGAIGSINQWGPFARLTGVVLARSVLFYGLRLWRANTHAIEFSPAALSTTSWFTLPVT